MLNFSAYHLLGSTIALSLLTTGCKSPPAPPEPEPAQPSAVPAAANQPAAEVVASAAVTANSLAPNAAGSNSAVAASSNSAVAASSAPASSTNVEPPPSATAASAPTKTAAPGEDPEGGTFTLDEALKGLPKTGKLIAEIQTDAGRLKCELYEDKAPLTVANFVGLARGLRPFKDPKTSEWVKRPAYDDGVFHRIIKGFMIQGGDPTGTGRTDGGYVFADEVWSGAAHDRRGLICMANKGKNTNSMQFFITDGAAPHLDGGYTIFGSCSPDATIEKLAATEVRGDRAVVPPKIKKITIKRSK